MGPKAYTDVATQTSYQSLTLDEASQRDAAKPYYSSPDNCSGRYSCDSITEANESMPSSDLRMSGKPHLPLSVPSQYSRPQNRAVSLPDRVSGEEHLESLIDQSGNAYHSRVVSLPESMIVHSHAKLNQPESYQKAQDESSEQHVNMDTNEDSYINSTSLSVSSPASSPNTVLIHSLTSELSGLPSSPSSSCDSVEFTLNEPVQLSGSFLRSSVAPLCFQSTVGTNKCNELLEDDGWITWSDLPPRPIPALHGPSSLPYARCPSGAEGTIIEEQSSLPRMIWGLDPDDFVSPSHVDQLHSPLFSRNADPPFTSNGKLSRQKNMNMAEIHNPHKNRTQVNPRHRSPNVNNLSAGEFQSSSETSLTMTVGKPKRQEPEDDQANYPQISDQHQTRLPGHEYDSGIAQYIPLQAPLANGHNLDFEMPPAMLLGVPSSSNIQRGSTNYGPQSNLTRLDKTAPNFIELLPSPLQPLNRFGDLLSQNLQLERRTSYAIQSVSSCLPTPPNSSSPRWSAVFSPMRQVSMDASRSAGQGLNSTDGNELSDGLNRLMHDSMTPVSTPIKINAPRILDFPTEKATSTVCNNASPKSSSFPAMSSSTCPPSPFDAQKVANSKYVLSSPVASSSMAKPACSPPSPAPRNRSTLSNPRSIPLSRLRQKNNEAGKLAPVPEEEAVLHPRPKLLQILLHSLTLLDPNLQTQTIDETLLFDQNPNAVQLPLVKLPCKMNANRRKNDGHVNPAITQSEILGVSLVQDAVQK